MSSSLCVSLPLFALIAGVVMALTGCSGTATPAGTPAQQATTAVANSSISPMPDDPPGTNTCHQLVRAVGDATLMDLGVVDAIAAASSTADAPIADAAQRLAAAYAAATTAKGTDSEPDAVAAVSAAGADMAGVCDDSGLETVG
jgi:hypothetical protein